MAVIFSARLGTPAPPLQPQIMVQSIWSALPGDVQPQNALIKVGHVAAGTPSTTADLLGTSSATGLLSGLTGTYAFTPTIYNAQQVDAHSVVGVGGVAGQHVWAGLYDSTAGLPAPLLGVADLGVLA